MRRNAIFIVVALATACCRRPPEETHAPAGPTALSAKPTADAPLRIAGIPGLDTSPDEQPAVCPPPPPDAVEAPAARIVEREPAPASGFPDACRALTTQTGSAAKHRRWHKIATIRVGQSHLDTVDISPDESLILLMSGMEGSVRIYDLRSRRLLGNHPMYARGSFARGQALFWRGPGESPRFLFGSDAGLDLYDARTGEHLARLSEEPAWQLRWTDDDRFLAANLPRISNQTSSLRLYEATGPGALTPRATYDFAQRMDAWDLTCDNRLLAATFYPTDDIRLYDLSDGDELPRLIWTAPAPQYSDTVDVDPSGARIAVGGDRLLVMDLETATTRATFERYGNNLNTARFHPDGGAVITTSYDGQVQVIRPDLSRPTMRRLKRLRHRGTANVYGIAFYRSGDRMITTSGDRTAIIWAR